MDNKFIIPFSGELITTFLSAVPTLISDVSVLQEQTGALGTKVSSLETKVSTLETDVSALGTSVSSLLESVEGISSSISSLDSRVESAESNISSLESSKANIDGFYEDLTSGNALQIVSNVYTENSTPYLLRTSAGGIDIGSQEIDNLAGGSYVWNQLVKDGNFTQPTTSANGWGGWGYSVPSRVDNILTIAYKQNDGYFGPKDMPVVNGHRYLFIVDVVEKDEGTNRVSIYDGGTSVSYSWITNLPAGRTGKVWTANRTTENIAFYIYGSNTQQIKFKAFMFIDLTKLFRTALTEYIISQSMTYAYFRSQFPKNYYPYSTGNIISVKTSAHKTIGFNAYNPVTGVAKLIGNKQYQITGTYTSVSYVETNGNSETLNIDTDGKFTPVLDGTLTVTGGNATDTCVHLVWDGERDGEFEEYTERVYALDSNLELRGIPKLDADNNLYYDGDTYESDGTVTRHYAIRAYESGDESLENVITDGTNTIYKLATPTIEIAAPYQNPQIVDDWGTEEYIDTRDIQVPVGHLTKYTLNLRAKLEMAPNSPDTDGDYILRRIGGKNTYTSLPTLPSSDGTYILKATASNGSVILSWVAET